MLAQGLAVFEPIPMMWDILSCRILKVISFHPSSKLVPANHRISIEQYFTAISTAKVLEGFSQSDWKMVTVA